MNELTRRHVLRAAATDPKFLKDVARDIRPEDFETPEEQLVAKTAVNFYVKHDEPVGALLSAQLDANVNGTRYFSKPENVRKAEAFADGLLSEKVKPVSIAALVEMLRKMRHDRFYETALDKVLKAHEEGTLTVADFAKVVRQAETDISLGDIQLVDFLDDKELEHRIARRKRDALARRWPLLLIDPFDEKSRAIGRGHTGLVLAPLNAGKGMFLCHLDVAYAMQGLNVLHVTLEDPKEEVEDRLDAGITGLSKNKLAKLPKTLRRRLTKAKEALRARIHIYDGTQQDMTLNDIEKVWEVARRGGFFPDVLVIDYDDYVKPEKEYKGERANQFAADDFYKRFGQMAARLGIIGWTAAQATQKAEKKLTVSVGYVAESINKMRKVALAIGLGTDPENQNHKRLYVARHRFGRRNFGVDIICDLESALIYDREATMQYNRRAKAKARHAV